MSSCSETLHGGKKRSMKRRTHGKRSGYKKRSMQRRTHGKRNSYGKARKTVRRQRKTRSIFGKLFGF